MGIDFGRGRLTSRRGKVVVVMVNRRDAADINCDETRPCEPSRLADSISPRPASTKGTTCPSFECRENSHLVLATRQPLVAAEDPTQPPMPLTRFTQTFPHPSAVSRNSIPDPNSPAFSRAALLAQTSGEGANGRREGKPRREEGADPDRRSCNMPVQSEMVREAASKGIRSLEPSRIHPGLVHIAPSKAEGADAPSASHICGGGIANMQRKT